ncbi:MAG: glycosyltransferase family 4 protein [Planctomycetes bacterium]|nr:glycosyltransferase family 4 protein [Planctomycetota bacterium]
MRILHILTEWKWTGLSEPVFNLASSLKTFGHDIIFACLRPADRQACLETPKQNKGSQYLPERLLEKGIETIFLKHQGKLTALFSLISNINKIEKLIQERKIDIIHTHNNLTHFIAAKAIRHIEKPPKIIRTNHKGIPLMPSLITNWLIRNKTDVYTTLSKGLLLVDREMFNIPPEKSWHVEGAINLERFNPVNVTKNLRAEFGIQDNDIVFGVVARIQRHRRFEILLAAFYKLVKEFPNLKLLVIGRGTHQHELLTEPVKELGLKKNIIHAGYRKDDYVNVIAMMDAGIFLVPGSDGSCRAAREMMAMGKPLIVSRRGILPELIQNNLNGLVIDDTIENLINAVKQLINNRALITQYGKAARARAIENFSLDKQVKQIEQIYQSVLPAGSQQVAP